MIVFESLSILDWTPYVSLRQSIWFDCSFKNSALLIAINSVALSQKTVEV